MRNQTSARILVLFWFLNLTFSTAAQTLSKEQIDNLLKKVEVQTIDAREMALVPLRVILEVALERSLSMGIKARRGISTKCLNGNQGTQSPLDPDQLWFVKRSFIVFQFFLKLLRIRMRKFVDYQYNERHVHPETRQWDHLWAHSY